MGLLLDLVQTRAVRITDSRFVERCAFNFCNRLYLESGYGSGYVRLDFDYCLLAEVLKPDRGYVLEGPGVLFVDELDEGRVALVPVVAFDSPVHTGGCSVHSAAIQGVVVIPHDLALCVAFDLLLVCDDVDSVVAVEAVYLLEPVYGARASLVGVAKSHQDKVVVSDGLPAHLVNLYCVVLQADVSAL